MASYVYPEFNKILWGQITEKEEKFAEDFYTQCVGTYLNYGGNAPNNPAIYYLIKSMIRQEYEDHNISKTEFADLLERIVDLLHSAEKRKQEASKGPKEVFYVSLHTADPYGGHQTAYEANYVGYKRAPITSSDWFRTDTGVANSQEISFPESASSLIISHFGVGKSSKGDGVLYRCGAFNNAQYVDAGISLHIPIEGLKMRILTAREQNQKFSEWIAKGY